MEEMKEEMEKEIFNIALYRVMVDTCHDYKAICKCLMLLVGTSMLINLVLFLILFYGKGYFTFF